MLDVVVDVVGVAGFALSLALAIIQIVSNRLSVGIGRITVIDAKQKAPESLFLFFTLSNRTRQPFSLSNIYLYDCKSKEEFEFSCKVRTYSRPATEDRAEVKPVVLSPKFPVRFEPYGVEVFLLELSRQRTSTLLAHPDVQVRNPKEHRPIRRFLRRLYKPRPRLLLKMSTSRGRRAIPILVSSAESWDYLEKYAVRKAAHEEKVQFPQ